MAGRVDDVETLALPESGRRGGRDGYAALLLLLHPIHRRGAFVHLADLMALAGVVEDPLRGRGLPGIDVGHDAEVSVVLDLVGAGHGVWLCRIRLKGGSTNGAGDLAQTARARKGVGWW